jgi:hypothetical protein
LQFGVVVRRMFIAEGLLALAVYCITLIWKRHGWQTGIEEAGLSCQRRTTLTVREGRSPRCFLNPLGPPLLGDYE